jgi:multiple sugar transport system permease protein
MTRVSPVATALRYLVLSFGAVIMLAPFAYMLGTSFKSHAFVQEFPPKFIPNQPTLDN